MYETVIQVLFVIKILTNSAVVLTVLMLFMGLVVVRQLAHFFKALNGSANT